MATESENENLMVLGNRMRSIDTEGVIYHYCSPETFINIISNKTIRYSDINMLNDAEEGIWGYRVFEEAVSRILNRVGLTEEWPTIENQFFDEVDSIWPPRGLPLANFVSCFSTDGDSLSQWRAYADDGRGFAIGFNAKELRRQPIQILDVLYDYEKQVNEMMVGLGSIYLEFQDRGQDYAAEWFRHRCMTLGFTSIAFKNPAWRDELEVRCQHLVTMDITPECWRLIDQGGFSDNSHRQGEIVRFQSRNGAITPYIDMPFEVSEKRKPIVEIVMGPKCNNSVGNVLFFLGNHGYGVVPVKVAGSAYR